MKKESAIRDNDEIMGINLTKRAYCDIIYSINIDNGEVSPVNV